MSATVKKWVNRGGLGLMIVGLVIYIVTGGDPTRGAKVATWITTIAGPVMIAVREFLG